MWSVVTLTVEYSVKLVLQKTNIYILYTEKKINIFQLVMATSKIKRHNGVFVKNGKGLDTKFSAKYSVIFVLSTSISDPDRLGSAGSESNN
jgi:hypothetical protein